MVSIQPVDVESFEEIGAFMAHVIDVSVDASEEEKARFIENTQANLSSVAGAPGESVHLRCIDSDARLLGVVLVRDHWNLCHLFVAPNAQGRGIGRALLEAAIARCRGRSPRGAIVLNSSRNAIGFYRRFGFTEVLDVPAAYRAVRFQLPV